MKPAAGGRSLFWTFAGVLLLVLAAATALQVVVSVAVLGPLSQSGTRARADLAVTRAAQELAAIPRDVGMREVRRVLHVNRLPDRAAELVFLAHGGGLVPERPLPPPLLDRIVSLARANGIADAGLEFTGTVQPDSERFGPDDRGPPPDRRFGGPPPDRGEFGPPPDRGGPRRGGRRGGGPEFGGPPEGLPPEGDRPPPGRAQHLQLVAQQNVTRDGQPFGTVAAIAAAPPVWGGPESRGLLLFVPFAVLAAAIAGLLMVRLVVRRLRALDVVAARVGEGDLSARVDTTGSDEIGRLEERFNHMTERLAAARDRLEDTDRQRRRLLADITHELATPLTSIRGYVETLMNPDVPLSDEERATYLNDVLEESKRLDLLISDLFDLVRLEAGAHPLSPVRLDWAALCRHTARRLEARFRDAGLTLRWRGSEGEAWIEADGRRMEQVIENLLVNALRYVPAGGTVEVALDAAAPGGSHRLMVSDDGPGIDPDDLPHVFERFYRAARNRHAEGSGLGLAIVREIIERHGGRVWAERAEPHGARFVLEMPARG